MSPRHLIFLLVLVIVSQTAIAETPALPPSLASTAELDYLPLIFEPNHGQAEEQAQFVTRTVGLTVLLEGNRTELVVPPEWPLLKVPSSHPGIVSIELIGSTNVVMKGTDLLLGKSHYYRGKDTSQWITDIPQFGKVKSENVYPNIDMVYYGTAGELEYDFVVNPGADPDNIRFHIIGADDLAPDKLGNLTLKVGVNRISLKQPVVYQVENHHRTVVSSRYVIYRDGSVSFDHLGQ